MGVDLSTYRSRIGTFRHGSGLDVVLLRVFVSYNECLKMIGAVTFVGLLLLMAGIETNPGPLNQPTASGVADILDNKDENGRHNHVPLHGATGSTSLDMSTLISVQDKNLKEEDGNDSKSLVSDSVLERTIDGENGGAEIKKDSKPMNSQLHKLQTESTIVADISDNIDENGGHNHVPIHGAAGSTSLNMSTLISVQDQNLKEEDGNDSKRLVSDSVLEKSNDGENRGTEIIKDSKPVNSQLHKLQTESIIVADISDNIEENGRPNNVPLHGGTESTSLDMTTLISVQDQNLLEDDGNNSKNLVSASVLENTNDGEKGGEEIQKGSKPMTFHLQQLQHESTIEIPCSSTGINPATQTTVSVLFPATQDDISVVFNVDDSIDVDSKLVSRTLDSMGYSEEMNKSRVQHYVKTNTQLFNDKPELKDMTLIQGGSKGEGLALPYESDTDFMLVSSNIICADDQRQVTNLHDYTTVLQMDRMHTPPGYTQLKLGTLGNTLWVNKINNSIIQSEGREVIVSSDFFQKQDDKVVQYVINHTQDKQINVTQLDICGPSSPFTIHTFGLKITLDFVAGFYCNCPVILESWANRHRMHGCPTPELVHDIVSDGLGTVVPVGFKGSDNQHSEWRICFSAAEQNLIINLNDTQKKLYILLKMVAKNIIRPVFTDITSYVMKNIVLWLAELTPQELFREELLIDRLMQALSFLRHSVMTNCLPSYMIPQRNLLARKLTSLQRNQLAAELFNCIQQGGTILLKCNRLHVAMVKMYKNPRVAIEYGRKRDTIENAHLLVSAMQVSAYLDEAIIKGRPPTPEKLMNLLMHDEAFSAIVEKMMNLVIPGYNDLPVEVRESDETYNNFLKRLIPYLSDEEPGY